MTALANAAHPSPIAVFRNRSFTLLWTAQLVSSMGTALTSLAASILVFRLTGSALSVGLMMMATALPTLVVGLIAGVFVDRYDRKRIMLGSNLLQAVLVGLIPLLLPFGIVWLYLLIMLSSAVNQFFDPAQGSVLPEVASDEELAAANSMMTISSVGSNVIGFAAAGVIASQLSINWAFYIDALTFVASALCIACMRVPSLQAEEDTSVAVVVRNLRAGLQFVRDTVSLRSLLLLYLFVGVLFGFSNALNLPFALRALGATEFEYGLIEGVSMVGFVLGSVFMASRADRLHEGQWVTGSIFLMGVFGIMFALSPSIWFALAAGTLVALMNAPSYIARQLLIQRQTPREFRGRVNSAFLVTRDVAFVIGMASVALADVLDVRLLMLLDGALLVGCGVAGLLLPGLRQPIAEWRRAVTMLRQAASAPGLGLGRAATLADFEVLVGRVPVLAGWSAQDRQQITKTARVYDMDAGTAIMRHGDKSDAAYFVLAGRAVAGRDEDGTYRSLEVLHAGDFFGEIAALSGVPRTADVIADQPTTLLQLPAATLRQMMNDPHMHRLFLSQMTTRMVRMSMIDLPRFAGVDQQSLRELRTPEPQPSR